jgi:undecaprenyl-diphosphatase
MFTWLANAKMHATLAKLGRYLSKTGDGQLYVLIAVTLYLSEGISPFVKTIVLAFLIERPVYYILKNSFKRNRPEAALKNFHSIIKPSDKFSFPSGHTSAAFMMATIISYFMPVLIVPLFGWAILIALSRVVLGVHFPTDTLMGIILGMGSAFFSLGQII